MGKRRDDVVMNKKLNGYFTVEMSMLMPFIIIIIFSVFYLCIYCHDRVAAKVNTYGMCINKFNEKDTLESGSIRKIINTRLIMGRVTNVTCKSDNNKVSVSMKLVCDIPGNMGGKRESSITVNVVGRERRKKIIKYKITKEVVGEFTDR